MSNIDLTIDGIKVSVPAGTTIHDAALSIGIKIPTLCHHPAVKPEGACRVCVVEVKNARNLAASCVMPVSQNMEVKTHSPLVIQTRKTIVELLLSNHPRKCLTCERNENCELRQLAADLNITEIPFNPYRPVTPLDDTNHSLVRDPSKCILCGRCIRACSEVQGVGIYSFTNRGPNTQVAPAFFNPLAKSKCTFCGQCAKLCPTGAIIIKSSISEVQKALADNTKHVVVQTAPSVRVGLSESLGGKAGDLVTGKMVNALKLLGFDSVLDTNFSADLTIMEEGHEFIHRLKNNGTLPMITSCSPGWVNFMEVNYPELLPHHSTAKSPQQMFGTMAKTYYAEKIGVDPKNIVSVAIMPCTAKKFEAKRPEFNSSGYTDVDHVLTTVELAQMIRQSNINFQNLENVSFDPIMGIGTGAGTIFGVTGGVMEAALRTAYEVLTGKNLKDVEFMAVRGMDGIREAVIDIEGTKVKVAVAHGLKYARKICEAIKAGNPNGWHFIEVMACPGGCVNGGGQPISHQKDAVQKRQQALYQDDKNLPLRKSHENPEIKAIYKDFLGEPNGQKAHKYLHTHYSYQQRD